MSDGWVVIPNWDKFQHYKDRDPTWIKLYLALNSDDDWLALTAAERGVLCTIWIEYARSHMRLSVRKAMGLCGNSARTKHIEALNHAGFIRVVDSKPLALARSREEEGTSEKTPPTPPQSGGDQEFSNDLKPGRRLTAKELRQYTGCRMTRGSHGSGYVHDPLGMDRPPNDWPHPKPERKEIELHLEIKDR